jgi:hypothetical protein
VTLSNSCFASGSQTTLMPAIKAIDVYITRGGWFFMRMVMGSEFLGCNSGTRL